MAFDMWGGYLAYAIGYVTSAAFLIAYRKDIFWIKKSPNRIPKEDYSHAAAA
jgi:hypothetical protein